MVVRVKINWGDMSRRSRRAQQRGMGRLTSLAHKELQRATPRRTGNLARRWKVRFRGMKGVVGNDAEYAGVVALGRKDRPMSSRERSNRGFHLRAIEQVKRKAKRALVEPFRDEF